MKLISEQVRQLAFVEYDINVWSEDGYVYLTCYPLRYPGEDEYPDADLDHRMPVIDTSEFYSLKIPSKARGKRFNDALAYLKSMVNYDHETMPEHYPVQEWDDEDGMDWWSTETELSYAPELITEFLARLPRRSQLERFVYGGN
jgi:hypothetical protein